ncbi:hypothetical protein LDENG_00011530 [Lucifuga dentata]|nr:hypothetical protein LDENG_00011530 [Lucifuga dentata]
MIQLCLRHRVTHEEATFCLEHLRLTVSGFKVQHEENNSTFSKLQSRFGQFSCLPFPQLRPSALPLPDHLGLLEV